MKIRYSVLFLILMIIGASCTPSPRADTLERNGLSIQIRQCGDGELTLLFIHGWCINQSYWDQQVSAFCKGYRVITMDLPGFGQSGKNRTGFPMDEYGNDVEFLIEELELERVVLIGHSMAGDIILEAAQQNEQVVALIGVDNFKDVGAEVTEETQAQIDAFMAALEQNFSTVAPAYAEGFLFHPSTDSLVRERIKKDFSEADSVAALSSLRYLLNYSSREPGQLSNLGKPLYLINSDATPTDRQNLDETGVRYQILDVPATGHYPMIEKPEEFNRLLKEALLEIENNI